ncbi:MAG: hypothetical protein ABSA01_00790 [Anaerolineales bacterium]
MAVGAISVAVDTGVGTLEVAVEPVVGVKDTFVTEMVGGTFVNPLTSVQLISNTTTIRNPASCFFKLNIPSSSRNQQTLWNFIRDLAAMLSREIIENMLPDHVRVTLIFRDRLKLITQKEIRF